MSVTDRRSPLSRCHGPPHHPPTPAAPLTAAPHLPLPLPAAEPLLCPLPRRGPGRGRRGGGGGHYHGRGGGGAGAGARWARGRLPTCSTPPADSRGSLPAEPCVAPIVTSPPAPPPAAPGVSGQSRQPRARCSPASAPLPGKGRRKPTGVAGARRGQSRH